MEKSLHTVTQRASGAQLSRAWLKTGGSDVYAQGLLLQTLGPYAPEVTLLPSQMGYVTIDAGRRLLQRSLPPLRILQQPLLRALHFANRNTRRGSARNIAACPASLLTRRLLRQRADGRGDGFGL